MPSGSNTSRKRSIATSRSACSSIGPRPRSHTRRTRNTPSASMTTAAPAPIQYSEVTYCFRLKLLFFLKSIAPIIELSREGLEPRLERDARRGPVEQGPQRRRHLDRATDHRLDDPFELRRVRRRAHDP